MSINKVFGAFKRKSTENGHGGEAPKKRRNLGTLATADTTMSARGLKTMGGVPIDQERSSSRKLYEMGYDNDMLNV